MYNPQGYLFYFTLFYVTMKKTFVPGLEPPDYHLREHCLHHQTASSGSERFIMVICFVVPFFKVMMKKFPPGFENIGLPYDKSLYPPLDHEFLM